MQGKGLWPGPCRPPAFPRPQGGAALNQAHAAGSIPLPFAEAGATVENSDGIARASGWAVPCRRKVLVPFLRETARSS